MRAARVAQRSYDWILAGNRSITVAADSRPKSPPLHSPSLPYFGPAAEEHSRERAAVRAAVPAEAAAGRE